MAGARSVECKCEVGRFTCGYCLRNAPPWLWSSPTGQKVRHDIHGGFRTYPPSIPRKETMNQPDWMCNTTLMFTDLGLFIWTSHYHSSLKHIFRPIKDNELWEWGFSA